MSLVEQLLHAQISNVLPTDVETWLGRWEAAIFARNWTLDEYKEAIGLVEEEMVVAELSLLPRFEQIRRYLWNHSGSVHAD